jgi:hypothetical protein
MNYPLINKTEQFPDNPICPICNKNKILEPHDFIVLDCGALLLNKNGDSIFNENLNGFLSLILHGHHNNKETYFEFPVVKDSRQGQFSLYFCSTDCLRAFFNNLVNDFEQEILKKAGD